MAPGVDAGSFRDPRGSVYIAGDRVFRTVLTPAVEDFEFVTSTGLYEKLAAEGRLVGHHQVDRSELPELDPQPRYLLEHPRLDFISHPYEWCFPALKSAALLHLDIQLEALAVGVSLSDATAFNIQFKGAEPVFVDTLSFRKYREGEFWEGHRQFCEQFLNPLLMQAKLGLSYVPWYRGSLEGIPATDLSRILPFRHKLSWNVFTHVALQAYFQRSATKGRAADVQHKRKLPRKSLQGLLEGMRNWIARLEPRGLGKTVWSDYAGQTSYSDDEARAKHEFVKEFTAEVRPATLWDVGCNTGDYSITALNAGAGKVIGFDFDHGAVSIAFARARRERLDFLPLLFDAANPTPSQGWAQAERKGMQERAGADGLLALALVHHLAITRNVPLKMVVHWLIGLAPSGVIEFVPKSDPMGQELLRLREDIFDDYCEESLLRHVQSRAEVVRSEKVSKTGRLLLWYRRR